MLTDGWIIRTRRHDDDPYAWMEFLDRTLRDLVELERLLQNPTIIHDPVFRDQFSIIWNWLLSASNDRGSFHWVCSLIQVDPRWALQRIRKRLKRLFCPTCSRSLPRWDMLDHSILLEIEEKTIPVFVYGSLMQGQKDHYRLGSRIRSIKTSISGLQWHAKQPLHLAVQGPGTLHGECHWVDEETLNDLDLLMGYPHAASRDRFMVGELGVIAWIYLSLRQPE